MKDQFDKLKTSFSTKKFLYIGVGAIMLILFLLSGKLIENVDNSEIVIIQSVFGNVKVHDNPGPVWQGFGIATHYKKSNQFWFSKQLEEGNGIDQSVNVRFNDGGQAKISGSVRWYMPSDERSILKLHTDYRSHEGIEQELIRQVITKSIYMTGPLMSSKESSAEKRNYLLSYIEDQSINGIYKTTEDQVKVRDELTNSDKIIKVVKIVQDTTKHIPLRQDKSSLLQYNITMSSLNLNSIDYSSDVETQIKLQQKLAMDIQTAISNARKAEQDAITTEQTGRANAAKAKWDQEVVKAKLVTEAQQKKEVAELEVQTASLESQKLKIETDAQYYKNSRMVSAGLTPQEKAKFEMDTKIGIAEAMSKVTLPQTYITGGSNGKSANLLESLLGVKLLDQKQQDK